MPVYKIDNKKIISPLFDGWDETFIWSCLQDCMGDAYADDLKKPHSAQIILGDIHFMAGTPNPDLIRNRPVEHPSEDIIMVPRDRQWEEAIERVLQDNARRFTRYATKKEKDAFDKPTLQSIVSDLPGEYALKMIGRELYEQTLASTWAVDLCGNYLSYDDYRQNGIGVVILKDGEIVSGASSYFYYIGGIEIEVDTREDMRRKGLASVCGAKLILECLERNLYPSWDAHDKRSLLLAEKLGYKFDKEYTAYELGGFGSKE